MHFGYTGKSQPEFCPSCRRNAVHFQEGEEDASTCRSNQNRDQHRFFRDNPIVLCLLLFPLIKCGFLCQKEEWYLSELKTCTTAGKKKRNHIHPDVIFKKHVLQCFFRPNKERPGLKFSNYFSFLHY